MGHKKNTNDMRRKRRPRQYFRYFGPIYAEKPRRTTRRRKRRPQRCFRHLGVGCAVKTSINGISVLDVIWSKAQVFCSLTCTNVNTGMPFVLVFAAHPGQIPKIPVGPRISMMLRSSLAFTKTDMIFYEFL